ncbi:MAG: glycosyltransferase family 39 protein, partial [Chloroflexi bacterium]|nr:glycosyltransferase family 39 protein [Chloroflexota bacterium]
MRSAIKRGALPAPHWDRSRWLAVGLTLLAWALMSWRLDEKSLWWDESLSLYRAQQNVRTILAGRIDFPGVETVDQHPPLYFLLLKGVIALGGEADTSLRLPSAFFGVILVTLLYVGGHLLRNQRAGVLAALLGTISPFYLWYAQEARMYTMVTALTLAATLSLWWAIVRAHRMGFVGFGLLAAAALMTHYLTALLLVYWAILALALWGMRPRSSDVAASSRWRQAFAWFGIGALAIAVFFLLWQLPHLIPAPGIYDKFVPLPIILRDIFNSYSLGLSVVFSK